MKLSICLSRSSKNIFWAKDPEGKMNRRENRKDFNLPTLLTRVSSYTIQRDANHNAKIENLIFMYMYNTH